VTVMDHSPILVVMAPLVGAYLTPLLGLWRAKLCYPVATAAVVLSLFFSGWLVSAVLEVGAIQYHVGGWVPPYGIELVVDPLSAFMLLIISLVSLLAVVYSQKFIERELPRGKTTSYYALILLLTGGMLGVVVTGDLFNLFVFTEIFSIAAYALVAIDRKKGSLMASYRYLIVASIGTSLILLGTGYLYVLTGTLNMADLSARLPALYDSWAVFGAVAFLLVGFGIKTALFPLHTWLPDAYSVAPAAVTVIFSALVSKVGAYSLIRVLFTIFRIEVVSELIPVVPALTWVAAATILVGSLFAISQTDIKKMLAYSSMAHIGYVVLGVGLAVEMGMTGGIFHIFTHALATGCLFFCAGGVIYKTGIRRIDDFRGLGRTMPLTMAAFTAAAASKVGIPPTAGFASKLYLVMGALEAGQWIFAIVILVGSLMTAAYYLRVIHLMYFRNPEGRAHRHEGRAVHELPLTMLLPILILALGSTLFGILVGLPLLLVEPAVRRLLGV